VKQKAESIEGQIRARVRDINIPGQGLGTLIFQGKGVRGISLSCPSGSLYVP